MKIVSALQFQHRQWTEPRLPPVFKSIAQHHTLTGENPLALQGLELLHVGSEVAFDYHIPAGVGIGAAAVVGLGGLAWGVAKVRSESRLDQIEGVGHLAMAATAGMAALGMALGHGHHGGLAVAALEGVHGLTELAVGVNDIRHASEQRTGLRAFAGAMQVGKGAAVIASACLPGLAPTMHLVALGCVLARTAAIHLE
ncbi:MAG: hypothetical protein KC910_04245 [Candidatus Eremiobacteraeota bacterium]|nr:hypothetical protein [Candidatus Eremiobacteraeota bacterium]